MRPALIPLLVALTLGACVAARPCECCIGADALAAAALSPIHYGVIP